MPLSKYFGGKGAQVMEDMQRTYGSKHGREVFYATLMKHKKKKKKHNRFIKKGSKPHAKQTLAQ